MKSSWVLGAFFSVPMPRLYITPALKQPTERANQEIALLREYCTRLFADVVTGQLDVRSGAGALSDEPDPQDAIDPDLEPDADDPDADDPFPGDANQRDGA